jgi:hypothetical protein
MSSEGRRRFLRRLGAMAAGAALAPTALRTLRVEPVERDLSKPDSDQDDRPRPGTRWIGHF